MFMTRNKEKENRDNDCFGVFKKTRYATSSECNDWKF